VITRVLIQLGKIPAEIISPGPIGPEAIEAAASVVSATSGTVFSAPGLWILIAGPGLVVEVPFALASSSFEILGSDLYIRCGNELVLIKGYGPLIGADNTPTIIDAHHLNLRVRPEVSALTSVGAVSVPITSTQTITIPALTVRRAETSVELGSGESFALAGLLQHTSEQDISKIPLLGDIPILGALFRSNRFNRNETELVIIVTPYLVQPSSTRLAAPTDGIVLPSDSQRVLFSDKFRQGLPGPARGPLNAGGKGLVGPGGFRLD